VSEQYIVPIMHGATKKKYPQAFKNWRLSKHRENLAVTFQTPYFTAIQNKGNMYVLCIVFFGN